jgi:hypothetical protein
MKPFRIAFAWLLIGIPLTWGVARSVQKSLPLFRAAPSTLSNPHPINPSTLLNKP